LCETLCDIGNTCGVNTHAAPSVQEEQASCILIYLAMPVPGEWWKGALERGEPSPTHVELLQEILHELRQLPQLARIDFDQLLALPFVYGSVPQGIRRTEFSLEDYLSSAEKVLASRDDLRQLGETVKKMANWTSS